MASSQRLWEPDSHHAHIGGKRSHSSQRVVEIESNPRHGKKANMERNKLRRRDAKKKVTIECRQHTGRDGIDAVRLPTCHVKLSRKA